MKYREKDLTETTKVISYLRLVQKYAAAVLLFSIVYSGFRLYHSTDSRDFYLLTLFTGVMIIGSLSVIIHLNHKTVILYGFSCVVAGCAFLFSLFYYKNVTPVFVTAAGLITGILGIRHGVHLVFGKRSQEIFSRANQKKISFVRNLIKSMKESSADDRNMIHCTYSDDGKIKTMKIAFQDDIACLLLGGQRTPIFFDRDNIYLSEHQAKGDSLRVSVVADNHDWLEADLKRDDFKKYQKWKDL